MSVKITRELITKLQTNSQRFDKLTDEEREAFRVVYNGRSRDRSNIMVGKPNGPESIEFGRVTPLWHNDHIYQLTDTAQARIEGMIKGFQSNINEKYMNNKYERRIVKVSVGKKDVGIFDQSIFTVEIDDNGDWEFIVVNDGDGNSIRINPEEWTMLMSAIDDMVRECR